MVEGTSPPSPLRAPRLITSTPLPRPSDGRRGRHHRSWHRGGNSMQVDVVRAQPLLEVTSERDSGCGGCVDRAQHGEAACLLVRVTRRAQMGPVPSAVRETASPNGPCVIRRPAVTASSTIVRKGVAGITQDWTGGAHACSFPDGGWHLPHLRHVEVASAAAATSAPRRRSPHALQ